MRRIGTLRALLRVLWDGELDDGRASVLIYTSVMAPVAVLLRLVSPNAPIFYMVRGDEITRVLKRRRYVRAAGALLSQKVLSLVNCRYVFVCEDLRVLFEKRFGRINNACVLPNTLGRPLPPSRAFDGRVAVVGDFNTVKNIEWTMEQMSCGRFEVHLFGNRSLPRQWVRPWLHAHGVVDDLRDELRRYATVLVLAYRDAGFPNVLVEALEAGCGVVLHSQFPFKYLPLADRWRFKLDPCLGSNRCARSDKSSSLEYVVDRLRSEKRDFRRDNPELFRLIESNWNDRVWEVFG